ncbi:MAG: LysR family transcriptional regulator, partial [Candidatus Binatia bacterium]
MYSLNYQHLRYFWAVCRHGNLTRASAELRLTPQTVSTQIRGLEDGLGEKLFVRQGRRLVMTDVGRVVFRYAEEIFGLGKELQDVVRGLPASRPLRFAVGVADVVPKLIAHHLVYPAVQMEEPVHILCREGSPEILLAELAIHNLDVVLTDSPIPPMVKVRAYNHLLGECGVTFMAGGNLVKGLRKGFPGSLDGAPLLVPVRGTALRQ